MNKKIVMVSGLPRSMTTLICNILANNKNIKGGETSGLLELMYASRANYSSSSEFKSALTEEIMHESFLNFCRQGMNGYADIICKEKGAGIYLDKSRGWLHYSEFLREVNPDAKIIVMVRDIRSILSSFEKKWRENPSILDSRDIPSQQRFITVDQRVNEWLSQPPLGLALQRLYNAHQTNTLENMLVVRAEDLCKNQKDIMEKVYKFIDESYFEMDYSNVKQMTVENDRISDFGIYGNHTINPDVKPLKRDYDEILTSSLASSVKANYKWFYEAFNYF